MTKADCDLVFAIGASAGGLSALQALLSELPADFAAPIVVAIHSAPGGQLARTLALTAKSGPTIREIADGEPLVAGTVHVAPAAKHVLFQNGRLTLSPLVQDSGFRPSIDALFMTLAAEYRERAVAIVLSGTMDDGMRGAQVIYDLGGKTVVQDPDEAKQDEMPREVIRADHPHQVLPAAELGRWMQRVVAG